MNKEKIIYYISESFIWNKILDIVHHLMNKKPLWGDVEWCGDRFCRYCGGKKNFK